MEILATSITRSSLDPIRGLVREMGLACQQHQADRYFALNLEFHDTLIRATGNRKLRETYGRLVNELRLYRRLPLEDASNLGASLQEHQRILSALEGRDPRKAVSAMKAHFEQSLRRSGSRV